MDANNNAKLMSKKQIAEMLNVSTNTIDRWRREGRVTAIRVGKQVRFQPEQVRALYEGEVVYVEQGFFPNKTNRTPIV